MIEKMFDESNCNIYDQHSLDKSALKKGKHHDTT